MAASATLRASRICNAHRHPLAYTRLLLPFSHLIQLEIEDNNQLISPWLGARARAAVGPTGPVHNH